MDNNQNNPIQFEGQNNQQQYGAPNNAQNNQQQYGAPNNGQYNQQPYGAPNGPQPKQKIIAILLAVILGGWGAHHFYLGNHKKAIIYLAVALGGSLVTCGISAIVIWVLSCMDAYKIYTGAIPTDFYGNPLV